jgi:hypothetical protein
MSIESASYISDFNAAYPASTDGVKEGDDHIRLVKSVLKNTFPNITGPITATQGQLNNPLLQAVPGTLKLPYYPTSTTAATVDVTAYGLSLLASADAAAGRTLLGAQATGLAVLKAGDTMTGSLVVPGLTVSSNAPTITMYDTDWGNRYVHSNSGLIGFLNSSASWAMSVDNSGNVAATGNISGVSGSFSGTLSASGAASFSSTLYVASNITTAGSVTASGNITAYSDQRLKCEIQPIHDALGRVKQLTGVEYTRVDTLQRQIGFVAQDLEKVFPEVVETEGEYLSVAYGNITAALVEAVKLLDERIAELEAKALCPDCKLGV